jgi:hypothetical protein
MLAKVAVDKADKDKERSGKRSKKEKRRESKGNGTKRAGEEAAAAGATDSAHRDPKRARAAEVSVARLSSQRA